MGIPNKDDVQFKLDMPIWKQAGGSSLPNW
jgi:hypothetical protein